MRFAPGCTCCGPTGTGTFGTGTVVTDKCCPNSLVYTNQYQVIVPILSPWNQPCNNPPIFPAVCYGDGTWVMTNIGPDAGGNFRCIWTADDRLLGIACDGSTLTSHAILQIGGAVFWPPGVWDTTPLGVQLSIPVQVANNSVPQFLRYVVPCAQVSTGTGTLTAQFNPLGSSILYLDNHIAVNCTGAPLTLQLDAI
jgi:hypothetical protein